MSLSKAPPALARALADWQQATARVLAALAAPREDTSDPWLDQRQSPLGARLHCRACSSGAIAGARKVGRKWLARASAIDAYITQRGRPASSPASPPANDVEQELLPDDDEIERELQAVGWTGRTPRRALSAGVQCQ